MRRRALTMVALSLGSLALAGPIALDTGAFFSAMAGEPSGTDEGIAASAGSWVHSALHVLQEQDSSEHSPVHLKVPDDEALRIAATPHLPSPVRRGELRAHAYQFVSRVYRRPAERPHAIGIVRRGIVMRAGERVPGPGCQGAWYALSGGGVVCSRDGFAIGREPRQPLDQPLPRVTSALPYAYAKVTTDDALRFHRIPTEDEERDIARALEHDMRLPDVVDQRLDGVYLVALARQERAGARVFHRTVRGRYVRAHEVEPKDEPGMRGELLSSHDELPYAFVYGHDAARAPVYRISDSGALLPAGVADVHARLPVARELTVAGQDVVVDPSGLVLPRSRVRLARKVERPASVPANAKWIHVDLTEQVLVAYEGERPVFATLVSSGKGEEFATPTGLYRVDEKHISTTMRGPDPDEGVYEVGEVPWTMFYDEGYALHGAYWHDMFGETRSHGCTNIAPIDARWLFYWSDGDLPRGFHAIRNFKGTYVLLTRATEREGLASG